MFFFLLINPWIEFLTYLLKLKCNDITTCLANGTLYVNFAIIANEYNVYAHCRARYKKHNNTYCTSFISTL